MVDGLQDGAGEKLSGFGDVLSHDQDITPEAFQERSAFLADQVNLATDCLSQAFDGEGAADGGWDRGGHDCIGVGMGQKVRHHRLLDGA